MTDVIEASRNEEFLRSLVRSFVRSFVRFTLQQLEFCISPTQKKKIYLNLTKAFLRKRDFSEIVVHV
jgi:hypothetical protein